MARPRNNDTANVGAYLGKVTRVTGRTCYVEVPSLARGLEYGPARYPDHLHPGTDTDTAGDPTHAHGFAPLAAGDPVAVAFLAGHPDNLVVLARLA